MKVVVLSIKITVQSNKNISTNETLVNDKKCYIMKLIFWIKEGKYWSCSTV